MLQFGQTLNVLTKKHNISNYRLAKLLSTSESTIANWLNNSSTPKMKDLYEMSKIFNVSINFLFGIEDNNCAKSFLVAENNTVDGNCVIAYIDVLGIKEKLKKDNKIIYDIKNAYEKSLKILNARNNNFSTHIKAKIFSDNVIFAMPFTSRFDLEVANFLALLQIFQQVILSDLYMTIRGGITIGELFIDETFTLGQGLVSAYYIENDCAYYPRIIADNEFINLLSNDEKEKFRVDVDGMYSLKHFEYITEKDFWSNFRKENDNDNLKMKEKIKINYLENNYKNNCYDINVQDINNSNAVFVNYGSVNFNSSELIGKINSLSPEKQKQVWEFIKGLE